MDLVLRQADSLGINMGSSTYCVTLDMFVNISTTQFPHFQSGGFIISLSCGVVVNKLY